MQSNQFKSFARSCVAQEEEKEKAREGQIDRNKENRERRKKRGI